MSLAGATLSDYEDFSKCIKEIHQTVHVERQSFSISDAGQTNYGQLCSAIGVQQGINVLDDCQLPPCEPANNLPKDLFEWVPEVPEPNHADAYEKYILKILKDAIPSELCLVVVGRRHQKLLSRQYDRHGAPAFSVNGTTDVFISDKERVKRGISNGGLRLLMELKKELEDGDPSAFSFKLSRALQGCLLAMCIPCTHMSSSYTVTAALAPSEWRMLPARGNNPVGIDWLPVHCRTDMASLRRAHRC